MTRAPLVLKLLKPTGKWVSDADLRHDAVIRLGCPTMHGPPHTVSVKFLTGDLREKQKHIGGSLVVNGPLIQDLFGAWLSHKVQFMEAPDTVVHVDHPGSWFVVRVFASRRSMSHEPILDDIRRQAFIPGPVKFLTFWRIPKGVSVKGLT